MKLKFYMRGIGIAMIVTALLVGFSYRKQDEGMSNDEILARAKELGMIENNVLQPSASPDKLQNNIDKQPQESKEPEELQVPKESEEPEESKEPEESQAPKESEEPEESEGPQEPVVTDTSDASTETIHFEIRRGDSSNSVSQRLASAGLVADAKEYDRYLCGKGYDKRISTGIFEIPAGASEEEIALIITKQK